jgi:nucleoid-associated protein YgaU
MIEIICNSDEEKGENGTTSKSSSIRIPKNIKQIGDVSSDRKIYIEDYAFTYINSIAYGSPQEEQAGVLLGECQKSEDEKCLFIKGVIKARNTDENGKVGICFDEKSWNRIYSDIEKYFPNLQVVGWFAAMPDVNIERMRYLKRIHLDNFAGNMKTMYLINTNEKEENFYLYENGDLKKQKGYVCFYERNYEMQEYMLEKRGGKSVEAPEKDKVMKSIRNIIQEKEELKQQKRNATFMYGISSFMVVVVLVIGVNLMNSYEKMKSFDQSLNNIVTEISNLNQKSGQAAKTTSEDVTESGDIVPVNKLAGNVYPTEESSAQETTANQQTTQSEPAQGEQTTDKTVAVAAPVAEPTTEAPTYYSYTVKKGDTIMSICKSHYGNASKYSEVVALNNLEDANKLYVGQEIKLP